MFRVVGVDDLATFAYSGNRERMQSDLRNLVRQGLIEQRRTSPLKQESRRVHTLTVQGQHLIRWHGFVPGDQAIYSRLVKPKEAEHDTDLYRMYHKAADSGMLILRLVRAQRASTDIGRAYARERQVSKLPKVSALRGDAPRSGVE